MKSRKSKNAAPSQQIGEEFRGSFQNKAHKLKHQLGKAVNAQGEWSGSRHAGSSSPVEENEAGEADSSEQEEHTGMLWPSQVHNDNKQPSQLSSLWPSAQQSKATEETEPGEYKGDYSSFWPSQQDNKKKMNKKEVVLEEKDEDNSQESGDVDWLALPVAKPKEERPPEDEKSFEDEDRHRPKQTKSKFKPAQAEDPKK